MYWTVCDNFAADWTPLKILPRAALSSACEQSRVLIAYPQLSSLSARISFKIVGADKKIKATYVIFQATSDKKASKTCLLIRASFPNSLQHTTLVLVICFPVPRLQEIKHAVENVPSQNSWLTVSLWTMHYLAVPWAIFQKLAFRASLKFHTVLDLVSLETATTDCRNEIISNNKDIRWNPKLCVPSSWSFFSRLASVNVSCMRASICRSGVAIFERFPLLRLSGVRKTGESNRW